MMSRGSTTISLAVLFVAPAIAQSIQGANGTGIYVPSNSSEQVGLLVDGLDGITGPQPALTLYPLTSDWQNGLSVSSMPDAQTHAPTIERCLIAYADAHA